MPAPRAQAPLPGRQPLSKRTRQVFAIALALALAVAVVAAVVFATTSSNAPPPRALTLSGEDRAASPALVRAARAIGFFPTTAAGAGTLPDAPAVAAKPPGNPDLLPVGSQAPPFTLKTPVGRSVSLADFRGKAVLLEIFATWCPHCAAEAPHLRDLADSMPKSKFAFVTVDGSGADAPSVFAYHAYFGLPFPALLDPAPGASPVTFPDHGTAGPCRGPTASVTSRRST